MHFKGFTKHTFNKICAWIIFGACCYLVLMGELEYLNNTYYKNGQVYKRPQINSYSNYIESADNYLDLDVNFEKGYAIFGLSDEENVKNLFIDQYGIYFLLSYNKQNMAKGYINNISYITKEEERLVSDITMILAKRYKVPLSGEIFNENAVYDDDPEIIDYGYMFSKNNVDKFSPKDQDCVYRFVDAFTLLSSGRDDAFIKRLEEIKIDLKKF